ncbi:sulfatase, partial [Akkermansiaceae bacterium]|nr:sulfatase [Akkermansiaceae bacterium]
THAFAAYPVCSPSRSCLITGMYPSTTGTGQMRSAFPLPQGVTGFPKYLREAGYHTTNNVKTDYNSADAERLTKTSWVESSSKAHWRTRKKGQPFFAVFNDMTTHQSRTMVWPYSVFIKEIQAELSPDEIHKPNKVRVPSYYPNTSLIRRELARFHDCVTVMDRNTGKILAELEKDGLTEDTIIFFYSDHGSGMPRHKRLLTDSGMRVPLMVRVPKKWQHLVPGSENRSSKNNKLVSFVDFAPTVLALCGIDAPAYMQGHNFLNQQNNHEWVYGARDRVDEVFDCSRSVRNDRWLYIRNYHPFLGWNQPSVFSDLGEIRNEITNYSLNTRTRLSSEQIHYISPQRAPIEFYDCVADPENTRNLALEKLSPTQQVSLEKAQRALKRIRKKTRDVGCLPEGVMADLVEKNRESIADLARNGKLKLDQVWNVADSVGGESKSAHW